MSVVAYEQALALYKEVSEMHARMHHALADIEAEIKRMNPAVVVDMVYVLKQSSMRIDDTRKTINKVCDLAQKIGCALAVQSSANELIGKWATGYAQATEQPGVPHHEHEPAEYAELMLALGATDQQVIEGTLRPSFDGIGRHMLKLAEEGKPIPPGLRHARMIPKYTIVARAKKRGNMDDIVMNEALKPKSTGLISTRDY